MASKNIAFDTLPASIRKPGKYFEYNTRLAVRNLPANPQKVLIVAGKTAEGTLDAHQPVNIYSDLEARNYAGLGSVAHLMCRAAIRAYPYTQLQLIVVADDSAGLASTGTLTIAGTATTAGVVSLSIGTDQIFRVAAARNDTAADIAMALAVVVNAGQRVPVTATATGGAITLTARNKGETGNHIPLQATCTAPGVTATLAPMAGGQVNPNITDALAAVFAEGHTVIISPYLDQDNLEILREHLRNTGHALEQRGAVGVTAVTGTLSQGVAIATAINDGRITMALLPKTQSIQWEVAAAYGAVLASEEDPARPLNTLPLTGIEAPPIPARLGRTEQETALYNGLTPLEVGPGEVVQIVRALSTYIKDPQGIEDVSLLDITTIRTLDYVRKACRERISLRFPREKLSSRTPPKVRSELLDVLKKLEELEIVEEVDANKPMLIVERDLQDANRLNAAIPCDVVNGLHVFAGRIDLLL